MNRNLKEKQATPAINNSFVPGGGLGALSGVISVTSLLGDLPHKSSRLTSFTVTAETKADERCLAYRVKNNFWNIRRAPGCVWILKEMEHGAENKKIKATINHLPHRMMPKGCHMFKACLSIPSTFILQNPSFELFFD